MPQTQIPAASDASLLLIDIQPGIIENSHTNSAKTLKLAAKTAVKIANLLGMPIFVSLVPVGPKAPEPVDELQDLPQYTRHFAATFHQPEIRQAVAATGRKVLAIGGIVSEVAVLQGAMSAMHEGYTVYILTDCCGGLTDRTEQAAFAQLRHAGAIVSSVPSFFTTINGDFSKPQGSEMLKMLHGLMAKE